MVVLALALAGAAGAQNVKITPLGTHAGELCDRDRATLFEDPTGVRILYDAGASVTGSDDPRLGAVHVVLLSHAHGDHMGDQRLKGQGAGTCARPELVSAAPHSTTAEIAAAKNSALLMMIPMASFLGRKVENIRG
jgi:glyoxylase-like metal-dependent hydrolase (beta-lactamase superfamily II)